MYEKDIRDWDIREHESIVDGKNFMEDGFTMWVGTWSNFKLSIVDCLAKLKLVDESKKQGLIKLLKERNDQEKWFDKNNKQRHIDYIKKWGINPYHFVNIPVFLEEENDRIDRMDEEDGKEVDEDKYIDEDKVKDFIDCKENHDKLIKAIKDSDTIEELYDKVMEIRDEINNEVYEHSDEFLTKIEE